MLCFSLPHLFALLLSLKMNSKKGSSISELHVKASEAASDLLSGAVVDFDRLRVSSSTCQKIRSGRRRMLVISPLVPGEAPG